MKIPLLDLNAQYTALLPEMREAIDGVLESGQFILGPSGSAFETEVADYLGVEHAIGVASGTDALVLSLRALDIGPGDEVILPAFTFFATAGAVLLVGATPVLVDVDPDTYCIDVNLAAERVTAKTKAIIPVHLYGHPADMTPLDELAKSNNLKIVEDNAQAFGAEYKGQRTGGIGDVGCLSFYPTKNLGAYGDGGGQKQEVVGANFEGAGRDSGADGSHVERDSDPHERDTRRSESCRKTEQVCAERQRRGRDVVRERAEE